ncbi:PDZ domain-containing protein [Chitinophaga nivalis]|uniref:PDZ domain-containing protein n=1 Tax=Chitinophaga nivalis TaxID=2991709 RepID=A0ABT3IHJ9_9BACT|nr:PDZ domain-containing protein [Chitinophaga nivalis]MCW3466890.1 PDZ domain-containing protein [Chitinophaga nivalis]MCW3483419.1 PDZ domain-containing protein [Chitinophaga nivalis]
MKTIRYFFTGITVLLTLPAILFSQSRIIRVQPGPPKPGHVSGIAAALQQAKQWRQTTPGIPVTLELAPGTYYLDSTLLLTPADSHTTIRTSGNNNVTISGGYPVSVKWTLWKKGIYRAHLAVPFSFHQLYINDKQQVLARYPNYDSNAVHYNGTAADAVSPARVRTWQHPVGGYIHALHKAEWGGYHYRITGVNADATLQTEGGYQNNRQMGMHDQHRFVENILEELDAAHEWFYDASHQTLYYKPPPQLSLSTARVVISRWPEIVAVKGTADHPVQDVSFQGIRFAHAEATFMATREPLLRSDWTIYRGGAILLEGTAGCSIRSCEFDHNGGNAVFVSRYNRHTRISDCYIHDGGGNGICFVGSPDAVRSPLFEYHQSRPFAETDTAWGPLNNHYPDSCMATNNLICRTGRIEKQTAGIQLSMAMNITVSHNTIYDVPRAGINVSEGTWGGHDIGWNDVFNTVLETGDHGAFNSWGRDRWWYPDRQQLDSQAAAHPWMVKQDAIYPTRLHHNRFRCDHGWDIDLDDGSSNYLIYNNVCLNGGLKLREGFYRIVENNILLNNSFHPHVWFTNSHDVFRHNIVSGPYQPIGMHYWGDTIDYNLFPAGTTIQTPTDAHALQGDPLFMAPAAGDYRVKPGSPALQTGFQNFPMDAFGVTSPALKALAQQPPLPVLQQQQTAAGSSVHWKGAVIKNIETLGERSAAGMPDNKGVYVVSVPARFPYALQPGDVILQIGDRKVTNVTTLLQVYATTAPQQPAIRIFRNQGMQTLQYTN